MNNGYRKQTLEGISFAIFALINQQNRERERETISTKRDRCHNFFSLENVSIFKLTPDEKWANAGIPLRRSIETGSDLNSTTRSANHRSFRFRFGNKKLAPRKSNWPHYHAVNPFSFTRHNIPRVSGILSVERDDPRSARN